MAIEVEILYFEGCPNRLVAVERTREVLRLAAVEAVVLEVCVSDPAQARRLRFLGSPSIRVNGVDVEPGARSSHDYGLVCRTYVAGRRREGAPTLEMIHDAILRACAEERWKYPG